MGCGNAQQVTLSRKYEDAKPDVAAQVYSSSILIRRRGKQR